MEIQTLSFKPVTLVVEDFIMYTSQFDKAYKMHESDSSPQDVLYFAYISAKLRPETCYYNYLKPLFI